MVELVDSKDKVVAFSSSCLGVAHKGITGTLPAGEYTIHASDLEAAVLLGFPNQCKERGGVALTGRVEVLVEIWNEVFRRFQNMEASQSIFSIGI